IVEPVAKALCEILEIGTRRRGLRVLDIAGGSSIFGMTFLKRDPSTEITQLDWANVNRVAKKLNREWGLEGKIRYIDGEFRKTQVKERSYQVVIASNFCRFESSEGNRELFLKAYRSLEPGGLIAINDFLPNEDRTGPTFPLRFSVYTLTHTPEGECYTYSQYSRWLADVGFLSIESHGDIPETMPGTTLIVATKKERLSDHITSPPSLHQPGSPIPYSPSHRN
ncbi:MAG: methyltransferase, partial [Deltaproteobacteria bacterium]|nr:methyltransferase [Deltaproteobacteria bacterium]